ncbi:hypothetical protein WR25_02747 [Diploscapter pachys]|uniref:DUF3456 domain-containing protein n=1 Tax=Diploscapter pachys TaxID=2018661 RepID=A0A2A2LRP6_9BILA|nr:hypothetical protein WR25_02747 [Diploscapter pachys]
MLIVKEMEEEIAKVDPKKMIDVGSFRLDPNGEQKGLQQVAFARSEGHLLDLIERVCDKAKEYKLTVNTLTGKAVYVHKDFTYLRGDESKGIRSKLQNACESFIESREDELLKLLREKRGDQTKHICTLELNVCSSVDVSAFPPNEPPPEEETKDAKIEEEPSLDDEL